MPSLALLQPPVPSSLLPVHLQRYRHLARGRQASNVAAALWGCDPVQCKGDLPVFAQYTIYLFWMFACGEKTMIWSGASLTGRVSTTKAPSVCSGMNTKTSLSSSSLRASPEAFLEFGFLAPAKPLLQHSFPFTIRHFFLALLSRLCFFSLYVLLHNRYPLSGNFRLAKIG